MCRFTPCFCSEKLNKINILFNCGANTPPEGYTEGNRGAGVTPPTTRRNKKAPYGGATDCGLGEAKPPKRANQKIPRKQKSVSVCPYWNKLKHKLKQPKTIDITMFFKILFQCFNKIAISFYRNSVGNNRKKPKQLKHETRKALRNKGKLVFQYKGGKLKHGRENGKRRG